MLSRIEYISGLGLLHDVSAGKFPCERATIIYAENARGKSTFTSLMRSLSTNDTSELIERATIGGKKDLGAKIQFDAGKSIHTLTQGVWDSHNPDILVFDGHFVETNVYSGAAVNTSQRQQLLDFALGNKAVKAQKDESDAVEALRRANESAADETAKVAMLHPGLTLSAFKALPDSTDFAGDLAELQSRLHSARNADTIQKTPTLTLLKLPDVDLGALFDLLSQTLPNIHGAAEELLSKHLERLGNGGSEWLASGQPFDDQATCPYCGQSTDGIELIAAYQAHFDDAFQSLKEQVNAMRQSIETAIGDATSEALHNEIDGVNGAFVGWQEHCQVGLVPTDTATHWSRIVAVRSLIEAMLAAKADNVGEYEPSDYEISKVKSEWAEVVGILSAMNTIITANNAIIDKFKTTLASEKPVELEALLRAKTVAQVRHSAGTVTLLAGLAATLGVGKAAEKAKKEARDTLTSVMSKTLAAYREDTNSYLKELGARFEIRMLDKSYKGGARAVYSIDLFGEEVSVEGHGRRFETALSESDKRTLAFAFFLASTMKRNDIASKTIVIDDPVSSLDEPRRAQTMSLLTKVVGSAEQLVVLSHGIFFVRDLARRMADSKIPTRVLTIRRDGPTYSGIFDINIELECESGYFQQHRIITDYVSGVSTDALKAAQAIRKITEGYVHRRFPGIVPRQDTLGTIVEKIKKSAPGETLNFAYDIRNELEDINLYAREFHHETAKTTQPATDDHTVAHYCKKALAVIYGEPASP